MGWRELRQGWRQTGMAPPLRHELNRRLDLISNDPTLAVGLQAVHDRVRSSVRLHTRVHWIELQRSWRNEPLGDRLRQLPPFMLAPVSSVGRRLGGRAETDPADPSLAATWSRVWRLLRQPTPSSRVAPPS
jgi:hypothetical protein